NDQERSRPQLELPEVDRPPQAGALVAQLGDTPGGDEDPPALEGDDEPADIRRVPTAPGAEHHVGDLPHRRPVDTEQRQPHEPRDVDQTLRHLAKLASPAGPHRLRHPRHAGRPPTIRPWPTRSRGAPPATA